MFDSLFIVFYDLSSMNLESFVDMILSSYIWSESDSMSMIGITIVFEFDNTVSCFC